DGGTATGTTSLTIHNTTGPGEYTTGNGIPVVQAINGGTTGGDGTFALAGEVRAGFHSYYLFRSGLNGTNPNDWFLRSDFNGGNGGNGNGEGNGGGGPVTPPDLLPPDPPPGFPQVLPPGLWPIIGPEIATDGLVQPIARQMGLQTLGTLHQRVGDTL